MSQRAILHKQCIKVLTWSRSNENGTENWRSSGRACGYVESPGRTSEHGMSFKCSPPFYQINHVYFLSEH